MKLLKLIYSVLLLLTFFVLPSYATWSIMVIDSKTKEIGIAGASCTDSVYGIGAIVPGKGAVIVQAMSNPAARAQGIKMMMADAAPEEILKAMKDPMYSPEEQQYAVMTVNHVETPVTYTGTLTTDYKEALTHKGISVQGNTLTSPEEIKAVLNAAVKAQSNALRIEEILILALEEGAKTGGDRRCGDIRASSAFLLVAKPGDDRQHPFLKLIVNRNDEFVNAVEVLRRRYNSWKNSSTE